MKLCNQPEYMYLHLLPLQMRFALLLLLLSSKTHGTEKSIWIFIVSLNGVAHPLQPNISFWHQIRVNERGKKDFQAWNYHQNHALHSGKCASTFFLNAFLLTLHDIYQKLDSFSIRWFHGWFGIDSLYAFWMQNIYERERMNQFKRRQTAFETKLTVSNTVGCTVGMNSIFIWLFPPYVYGCLCEINVEKQWPLFITQKPRICITSLYGRKCGSHWTKKECNSHLFNFKRWNSQLVQNKIIETELDRPCVYIQFQFKLNCFLWIVS